jgi:hypothetical protein
VTRDFGHEFVGPEHRVAVVHESDTVMRFLQKTHEVKTSYGGGFVDSIDGIKGDKAAQHDWFYFVNGIEASEGAADFGLSPGDRVQWDYRDWRATMRVPAIVGAFPEPFVHGFQGKRLPVRVQCETVAAAACAKVMSSLRDAGAVPTRAPLGSQTGEKSIRVLVGKYSAVRDLRGAGTLERGPRASGVYARFEQGGAALRLLGPDAVPVSQAPPGSGLVAATAGDAIGTVWVVTGVDDEGVERAARELDQKKLDGAFAVAVQPDGAVRLPVVEREP